MKGEIINTKKKRVYQVAREFHISNEALIEFLQQHDFKLRNHMAPITDEMFGIVSEHFAQEEAEAHKEPDYRRRILEKREEDEARKEAIRHEIDELLERSKTTEFEPVEVVERKAPKKKTSKKTKKTEVPEEVVQEETKEPEKAEVPEEAKTEDRGSKLRILGKLDTELETTPKKKVKGKKGKAADEKGAAEGKEEKASEEGKRPKRHLKKRPKAERTEDGEEGKTKKKYRRRHKAETGEPSVEDLVATSKKKKRRKRRKPAVQIDEKEIEASIKETLAKMSDTGKRRRKKEKREDEVVIEEENLIKTTEFISVGELANLMDVESSEVIQACISMGLLVTINQRLDKDTILMVADEFGYDVKFLTEYGEERLESMESEDVEEDASLLEERPPVVTIMGHVDHGKTSLLDHIRESNIIAGESGGITQHIGAYEVEFKDKKVTFLDTPGHAAFTAMRARGAQVTDIVILVVAADDSVMPQTIEAINHARAAGVPMIVALNKMDKPNANPDSIKQQLADQNVLVEDWGGKVQCAELSAKTGEGVDHLLEIILLEAEVLELKANPNTKAKGVVVEAKIDKGRGVIGTVLIQRGTLRIGDPFVAGQYNGRVRAMFDERDRPVSEAPPSTPVLLLGFTGVPQAGDMLTAVRSEQEGREISNKRQQLKREQSFRQIRRLTLDQISKRIAEGEIRELSIIVKADVDGSLEAISDSLMNLGTEDVAVQIIHKGVGTITEYDVMLAAASQAVIIGFHVSPNAQAQEEAKKEQVDIRHYTVIYDIVNDVKLALSGLLEPEIREELVGTVEIRDLFRASKVGNIAGCYVLSGKVLRNHIVHLVREGETIYEGKISTLKRFKEDVKEVAAGYECGITLEDFKDIQVGDVLETYEIVQTERTLE